MNYIQYMKPGGNFGDKLKAEIKKFLKAAGEASRMTKDARINNPGAAMIRDAYAKGDKELAKLLTDEMQAANLTGIALGSGAGPLMTGFTVAPVTTGATLATGIAGGMAGMYGTDKAINYFSDGKYTGWGNLVNQVTGGTVGESTANFFHPGAILGGATSGIVGNKIVGVTNRGKLELLNSALNKNIDNAVLPTTIAEPEAIVVEASKVYPKGKTSLVFFERLPANITEAELAGIPKGERNSVLIDRGQLSKRFRWIDGELVPEYKQRTLEDDIPWWDAKNWDIHDGKVYTDADGVNIYKFRPPKVEPLDFTKSPIVNWGNELPEASFTRWDRLLNRPVTRAEFLRPPWQSVSEADIRMSKILKSVSENSKVSEKLISDFDNAMIEARFRLFYYNKGYYLSEDLTRRDIAKIVADNYAQLTATLQGKLKNLILWNGSSGVKQFDNATGQFTTIREAAPENFTIIKNGYRTAPSDREGIYFNTQPVGYDLTRVVTGGGFAGRDLIERFPDLIEYSVTKGDKLPYLINKVKNVIREYWPENLKELPEGTVFNTTQNKGNLSMYPQDPLKAHEFFVQSPENIKSLFPHPNLFVENADGTWSMIRSWDSSGLHYKSGGKLNYLNLMKNERLRTMEARS